MAGLQPQSEPLYLTAGSDFTWQYHFTESDGVTPKEFPIGAEVYYLIGTLESSVKWPYVIEGDLARIKIESEVSDLVEDGTPYRLFFKEATTPTTESPVLIGNVKRREPRAFRS